MKNALLILLLPLSMGAFAQDMKSYLLDKNTHQRERWVDFKHMDLEVSFAPKEGKVMGKVTHRFKALRKNVDTLYLDGVKMEISQAILNGQSIEYRLYDKGLTLVFPETLEYDKEHELYLEYASNPRRGLYFIGWDDTTGRCRKQIWTQGQGIDNRHWIPIFDDMADKITTDIRINMPAEYQVLSNGKLANKTNLGDTLTQWNYQMVNPHSPYLIMLGIGKYSIETIESQGGTPMNLYTYVDWPVRQEPTYRYAKEIFDFLEGEIGVPYPWGSYSQIPVQDFPYGAMENTSATVFGDFFCVDSVGFNDVNYVYVNGHELAHQWFGDLVTSKSPKHHWLHESFATYYHHLVVKQFFGDDEFTKMMRDNQNAALNGSNDDFKGVGHSEAGTHRHYLKGSYVLKMLRYVVGDDDFQRGMKYYLEKHQFENAGTSDLIDAFAESTGRSIGWFIDQWVYQGGEPHFKLDYHYQKKQERIRLIVDQTQDTTSLVSTFRMPVNIQVFYVDGSSNTEQFWIENSRDTFYLSSGKKKKIDFVLFDPNSEILKSVEFERPKEWLMQQALKAPYMIDRYDALLELRKYGHLDKEQTLHLVLNSEDFYLVRNEAMSQLMYASDVKPEEMKRILLAHDVKVQQALLSSVKTLDVELKPEYELMLDAPSYQLRQIALVRLCKAYTGEISKYLEQTKNVYGVRGNNYRIQWLEIKWRAEEDQSAIDELVDMTSNSYEFITRQNAMAVLKRLGYCNEQLIANLIQGMQKANWKLASSSGNLIKHFYQNDTYTKSIEQWVDEMNLDQDLQKRVDRYLEKK